MKNIRANLVAVTIGSLAFLGMTRPVYAQKMFVEQPPVEVTTKETPDPELKKILPLAFSDTTPLDTASQSEDGGLFATLFVDNITPPSTPKTVSTERTLPINSQDVIGISTFFTRFHPGVDLRAKIGTPIHATLPGTVNEISYEPGGYGKYVVLVHHIENKTYFSLYAHMKETTVAVGDSVNSGDQIGEVGLTGHTTGPHLHFEIHDGQQAIDPIKFLAGNNIAMAKK
jgi:murein DD-endopeptidase MepM/ murein hydrolase activator NlpD